MRRAGSFRRQDLWYLRRPCRSWTGLGERLWLNCEISRRGSRFRCWPSVSISTPGPRWTRQDQPQPVPQLEQPQPAPDGAERRGSRPAPAAPTPARAKPYGPPSRGAGLPPGLQGSFSETTPSAFRLRAMVAASGEPNATKIRRTPRCFRCSIVLSIGQSVPSLFKTAFGKLFNPSRVAVAMAGSPCYKQAGSLTSETAEPQF